MSNPLERFVRWVKDLPKLPRELIEQTGHVFEGVVIGCIFGLPLLPWVPVWIASGMAALAGVLWGIGREVVQNYGDAVNNVIGNVIDGTMRAAGGVLVAGLIWGLA